MNTKHTPSMKKLCNDLIDDVCNERDRLRESNRELLAACEAFCDAMTLYERHKAREQARAAIAKCKAAS